jgi:hypothetical protein
VKSIAHPSNSGIERVQTLRFRGIDTKNQSGWPGYFHDMHPKGVALLLLKQRGDIEVSTGSETCFEMCFQRLRGLRAPTMRWSIALDAKRIGRLSRRMEDGRDGEPTRTELFLSRFKPFLACPTHHHHLPSETPQPSPSSPPTTLIHPVCSQPCLRIDLPDHDSLPSHTRPVRLQMVQPIGKHGWLLWT